MIYNLSKTDKVEFHFVNGPVETTADTGIAEQYEGPYYRFFDNEAPHVNQTLGVAQSHSRQAASPESFGRSMREHGVTDVTSLEACDFLQQYIEQPEGDPFDGVLGFSEGASVVASLVLRHFAERATSPFKFAIFICGLPPFRWDCKGLILPDEITQRINIPTAHIFGSKDPFCHASMILYKLCHQPSTSLFDHCGSHTIPWDLRSTQGITEQIRGVIERSRSL